ncbi:helix-turn-helix transcriptional regulator [Paenibacillus sp. S-38]|uniref:helix-turn-helix transcriptional regulator n=1 Tax=Paenibacillus sp. S-38 TaxID=3416710 RepID=UPI003CEBBFAF
MSKVVGDKLVLLRGERDRSEVADAIGISLSALQMYENGNRIPRDHIKVRLANYYGVPVQSIFFDHFEHESCSNEGATA